MEYFERLGHRHAGPGGNWRVRRRLRHFSHAVRGSGSDGGSDSSSCRSRCASAAVTGQSPRTSIDVWKPGTRPCADRKPLRSGVDPIDLDPVKTKSVLGGPIQKKFGSLGIVDIGRRDQNRQNEAERAGQNMALDALDFLVAVEPTLTLLRAGDDASRSEDPGRWLRWAPSRTRRVSCAAASAHTPSVRNRSYHVRTV